MTVEPGERLTVVLEAQAWNVVLNVLMDGQFRVVQPLIETITRQCMQQGQAATRGNGEMRTDGGNDGEIANG